MSSGVSERASEWKNEYSRAHKQCEQWGASEWVGGAIKRENGRASGPVLTSQFLAVLNHSALGPWPCPAAVTFEDTVECRLGTENWKWWSLIRDHYKPKIMTGLRRNRKKYILQLNVSFFFLSLKLMTKLGFRIVLDEFNWWFHFFFYTPLWFF